MSTIELGDPGPLAGLFRGERLRMGLTQRELADLSTVSVRAIRDLERGATVRPQRDTVRLLAETLRLDADCRHLLENLAESHAGPGPSSWPAHSFGDMDLVGAPLLGRDEDVARLTTLVTGDHRLLGLTGLSGVGKTRLALEVAARAGRSGQLVLWQTRCRRRTAAPIPEQTQVHRRIDAALSDLMVVKQTTRVHGAIERLARLIGPLPTLLVLDSLDHPPPDGVIGQLLRVCPGLCVLYTATRPHLIPGERLMVLAPLPVPEGDPALVQLGQHPTLRMLCGPEPMRDRQEVRQAMGICDRLDGLPQALRMAADLFDLLGAHTLNTYLGLDLFGTLGAHRDTQLARRAVHGWTTALEDLAAPEKTLLTLMAQPGGPVSAEQLATSTGQALPQCATALDRLRLRGLVRPTSRGVFRVLNIVKEVIAREPLPS